MNKNRDPELWCKVTTTFFLRLATSPLVRVHVLHMARQVRSLGELLVAVFAPVRALLLVHRVDVRNQIVPLPKGSVAVFALVWSDFLVHRLDVLCEVRLLRECDLARLALEVLPPHHFAAVVGVWHMERVALVVARGSGVDAGGHYGGC